MLPKRQLFGTATPCNFPTRSRSFTNSVAVWQRCSGRFASILSTTPSNISGMANWYFFGLTGSAWRICVIVSTRLPPSKGGEAVKVRARVHGRAAEGAFRRHVAHVAEKLARPRDLLGQAAFLGLGQHQVAELGDVGRLADQHVLRRDVAVDDVLAVGVLQGAADADGDVERLAPVEHAGRAQPA